MCKWYCMSEGPNTNLECLHCGKHYCAACLHGDFKGKMKSLIKCGNCGKKPRTKVNKEREGFKGATRAYDAAGEAPKHKTVANSKSKEVGESSMAMGKVAEEIADVDDKLQQLEVVFKSYATFGHTGSAGTLDSFRLAKLTRDTKILGKKKLTSGDVDLIFTKVKDRTERKITFNQFLNAVQLMYRQAEKKYPEDDPSDANGKLINLIIGVGGPHMTGVTEYQS